MKFNVQLKKTEWGTVSSYSNNDNTVRFVLYTYDDDDKTIYFSNLFVNELYRNKGYANKILEWVFKYAKTNSFNTVVLNVVKNSWIQKWYERLGFVYVEDCQQDEYKGNVWMKKDL